MNPVWRRVNSWDKTTLYQVTHGKLTINVEIESITDGIGQLKRVQSSITNDFEEYGMKKVKEVINTKLCSL